MRIVQKTIDQYVADDGRVFNSAPECKEYEDKLTTIYFKVDNNFMIDLYKIIGEVNAMSRCLDKFFQQMYGNMWCIHQLSDNVITTFDVRNISEYSFIESVENGEFDNFNTLRLTEHGLGFEPNKDCIFYHETTGDI